MRTNGAQVPLLMRLRLWFGAQVHAVTVRFELCSTYPDSPCAVSLRHCVGVAHRLLPALKAALEEDAQANSGMPMVYTLAEFAREWIEEHGTATPLLHGTAAATETAGSGGASSVAQAAAEASQDGADAHTDTEPGIAAYDYAEEDHEDHEAERQLIADAVGPFIDVYFTRVRVFTRVVPHFELLTCILPVWCPISVYGTKLPMRRP